MRTRQIGPLLLLIGLAWAPALPANTAEPPPNIVFILADDLGINDLGCYGRREHHTPHLDRLAGEGIQLTSFYCAQPICSPSRAAILTGKAPARLHLTTYLPGRPDAASQKVLHPPIQQQLPLAEITLAEHLKRAGYATACIGKWHLGGREFTPDQQGFDFVFAGRANTTPTETEGGKGEHELTSRALEFIEQHRDHPFFLFLSHNNPHIPLAAQSPLIQRHRDAFQPLYAAVIETLDASVGRLLERVDRLDLRDRTIVVFHSDNGGLHVPELRDDAPTHNTPFRAGKGFLYEGGLRVPTLIRWPGRFHAGKILSEPAINTDFLPTFLELAGSAVPDGLDGVSLAGWLRGGTAPQRKLFWHFPHYTNQGSRPAGAVRDGNWKCIEQYEDGSLELYNLADDPAESHNLADRQPERAAELHRTLADWRRSVGAQTNTPNPDFNPSLHRQIYVDTDVSKLRPGKRSADMTPDLESWRRAMDTVVQRRATPRT